MISRLKMSLSRVLYPRLHYYRPVLFLQPRTSAQWSMPSSTPRHSRRGKRYENFKHDGKDAN